MAPANRPGERSITAMWRTAPGRQASRSRAISQVDALSL